MFCRTYYFSFVVSKHPPNPPNSQNIFFNHWKLYFACSATPTHPPLHGAHRRPKHNFQTLEIIFCSSHGRSAIALHLGTSAPQDPGNYILLVCCPNASARPTNRSKCYVQLLEVKCCSPRCPSASAPACMGPTAPQNAICRPWKLHVARPVVETQSPFTWPHLTLKI